MHSSIYLSSVANGCHTIPKYNRSSRMLNSAEPLIKCYLLFVSKHAFFTFLVHSDMSMPAATNTPSASHQNVNNTEIGY